MEVNFNTGRRLAAVRPSVSCFRKTLERRMRRKRKILVIEDDLSIAGSLKKELEAEAYEVALATQGEAGLELAKHQSFDVVVTDLKMPGLSGSDLVRQLRC